MITIEDCSAFCEADPRQVDRIARQEHLVMIMAFACAHGRAGTVPLRRPPGGPCLELRRPARPGNHRPRPPSLGVPSRLAA